MLALPAALALALAPAVHDARLGDGLSTRVRVVDEAGRPLAGAWVETSIWSDDNTPNRASQVGPGGVVVVERPKSTRIMRLWVSAAGYAGQFRGWEVGDTPPARFAFQLSKATTIGGRVVDAKGRPVPGVRVEAVCTVPANALADGVRFNSSLAYQTGSPETDANGYWELANAPAPATAFLLRFSHPDYVSDTRYGGLQRAQGVTDAQLRARTAGVTLSAGAKVSGTVTGPGGKPLAGAVVCFHDDPYLTPGDWEVKTDAEGKYTLPTLAPGRHPLTVVANGLQTEGRSLVVEAGPRVEDVRLAAGKPLVVKVVDEDGKPVPKVMFAIQKWRDSESLYNHKHPNVMNNGVPRVSDAAGVYRWAGAPADAVTFTVAARDFQHREVSLTADGTGQTLVLKRTPAVSATVADAATGKPVPSFRVTPVVDFGHDLLGFARYNGFAGSGGAFRFEMERSDCDYRLLVEAPGYRSSLSRGGLLKDKIGQLAFELEAASPVTGRVVGPDGKPVNGVKVSLANRQEDLKFPSENQYNLSATTGADGVFTLPAQAGEFVLFAEHPAGCARAERGRDDPAGTLTLVPWASVRGTLWQDGKPVAGQWVSLGLDASKPARGTKPFVRVDFQMQTDAEGRFHFERVPAEAVSVWPHLGPWKPSPLTSAEVAPLDLKPGSSADLDLNKGRATLTGRLKLAGDAPAGTSFEFSLNSLVRCAPEVGPGTPLTRDQVLTGLRGGPAHAGHRTYTIKPTPAGEFRVGGVAAGDYWLIARVYANPQGGCLVDPLGVAVVPVSVSAPQVAGGEVVRMGTVEVVAHRGPQVGATLPALDLRDAAGAPLDLAQFKGRTLLLHGWAGWCANCPKDYAAIKKLRAEVPAAKLAVVGLNLDADAAEGARLAAKYGFAWPQARPDEAATAKLAIGSVPLYIVVGADGRVKYRGLVFADAAAAVAR